ncbi:Fic family protein [uncultured Sneathia sp.]|uniref:Fic family protein n=1 Tax=uncultured Sneathia sp. TaxID=278067 RepID=UPI0025978752|nr:Fic family protein [uncultured Sneathia sp.]
MKELTELEYLRKNYSIPNYIKKDMLRYCVVTDNKYLFENLKEHNKEYELDYLYQLLNKEKITIKDILKIQEIVCIGTNVKTGFRNIKVKIWKNKIPIYKFKKELDRLLNLFYSSNSDIFSRLALFHLFFEDIHPFRDGNGRTCRVIMDIELLKHGYPIFAKNSKKYYEAFIEYKDNNNVIKMKEYLINEVYENMIDLKNLNILINKEEVKYL